MLGSTKQLSLAIAQTTATTYSLPTTKTKGTPIMISTPEQSFQRDRQQAAMKIQNRNLQRQLDRRMQVAIARQDCYLISQLQVEQEFLLKQL
jgi:hypothetical protein